MSGFTDIHSHVLYGIDDGARTRSDMENMLDLAYDNGITEIVATPHVTPGIYPIPYELIAKRQQEAQQYCYSRGYSLQIHTGAEIMYTPAMGSFLAGDQLPTLAGTDSVLVEFVPDIDYAEMCGAVEDISRAGYSVIIAHMERYACLRRPNRAAQLKEDYGIAYQMNCRTVLHTGKLLSDPFPRYFLDKHLIDFVASDAHDCVHRRFRMQEAYTFLAKKYGIEVANRLTGMDIG